MIKKAARERDVPTIRALMPVIIGVGVVLLIIRGFEFNNLNCRWTDDAYSSIIWALLFLHTTHILTDWGDTVVLWALMMTDVGWEGRRLVDTDENCIYWRYVWLLWIPVYLHDLLGAAAVKTASASATASCPGPGLALGTTGYFLAHQLGSDSTFQDCRVGSPLIVIIATLARPRGHRRSARSARGESMPRKAKPRRAGSSPPSACSPACCSRSASSCRSSPQW